jgi:hypothetical protein
MVTVRFVRFWSSELLPATAELEPPASVLSVVLLKFQFDSRELGSAVFGEVSADGPRVEELGAGVADSDGPGTD